MHESQDSLIARWCRAGIVFGHTPADESPDLERLLLDTARHAPSNARLFVMAVTWLRRYGRLIAKRRLKRLIRDELEPEHRPAMGLMLELAIRPGANEGLATAMKECEPAPEPQPLFRSMQRNGRLWKMAEERASHESRRWGRWAQPIELKPEALRPASWVTANNPDYAWRAAHRGDLRASVLETLQRDLPEQGAASEMALARHCLAQRSAVRHALEGLELEGRIERASSGRRTQVRIRRFAPAA